MKFGFQFRTIRSISIRDGDFFSCEILVNGARVNAAVGCDQYFLNTIILPEKRLSGSGRSNSYSDQELICGMGNLQARPFSYCELPNQITSLELCFKTNRILDYRELPLLLDLEIWWLIDNEEYSRCFSLQNPLIKIYWEERGTYYVDLTGILHSLSVPLD